ncbi:MULTISPECIES: helix-turn-helix domain-containing protein [Kitasatospora]|uniref:helix-turn-helix domain-containing protein n=1 Tax=Kitasatospora TaxID=2063 RepID=UPI000C70F917|nr:helix-turn-helix domain-containing protein [Kitasatospora sp. GP30]MDH6138640.1 transcriptional regulator with XRE-family HTH domain [Kitasatospora sp. GP30]
MDQSQSGTNGIGQRLRELRQKRGLNQQDLASADISVSYVSLIETGKRIPSEAVLKTLAERVGCSVDYLRSGRDDKRVKELELKIAFGDMALRNGANGEALQSFSEALAHAPLLGEAAVRRARLGQATAFEKLGRMEAAIQLYTTLFDDPAVVPGSAEWAQLAVSLCRSYRDAGDYTLSVEIGERAMKTLDGLGLDYTDDHIQLGSTLISCYQQRGDLTQAQLLINRLTRVADENGSRTARGAVYWNAAVVANTRGKFQESLAMAERALALMAESDNVRHVGILKLNCGNYLLDTGTTDLGRVQQLFDEAREALLECGNTTDQVHVEGQQARLALHQANPDRAVDLASRALGLLRNESTYAAGQIRVYLAQAQYERGDSEAAVETLHALVRQLGRVATNRHIAVVWRQVGDLWRQLGHASEALAAYDRALGEAGLQSLDKLTRTPVPTV